MKKVLSDNIMNLEDYILTASARHKFSALMAMELPQLWQLHDALINNLKGVIVSDGSMKVIDVNPENILTTPF